MSMKVQGTAGRSLEADDLDFLSPCGRGGDPLRSNGEVRGLPPPASSGDSPLTLPASRVPSLSRKGRGRSALDRAVRPVPGRQAAAESADIWHAHLTQRLCR